MRRRLIAIPATILALFLLSVAATQMSPGCAQPLDSLARFSGGVVQSSGSAEGAGGPRELRPTPRPAALRDVEPPVLPRLSNGQLRAHAYGYDSRIFERPSRRPTPIGIVRRGIALPVGEEVSGPGCSKGAWYPLVSGGGVVCSRDGFNISDGPRDLGIRQIRPDWSRAIPFDYGRITSRDALRYYRIPTRAEERTIAEAKAAGRSLPDVVSKVLDGDYFVALDRLEKDDGRSFYRTVRGRYVHERDVDPRPEPEMHGEFLGDGFELPLAFVYGEDQVPLLARDEQGVVPAGVAYKHARFNLTRTETWGEREIVLGDDDVAVAREHVRIARATEPPSDVGPNERWIHIDLDEQMLIAYEGERPVFATLVSTGLEDGYATPTGSFRVREKYISTTMRGRDPVDGPYEVEEVPWTMFYFNSYAVHGAYWHDDFGRTRSHGCTNLAPVDARWLFWWSGGEVSPGWHGRRQLETTLIHVTGSEGKTS